MTHIINSFLLGILTGLLFAMFTGVDDKALITHHCAYYNMYSGALTWYDTNNTVH